MWRHLCKSRKGEEFPMCDDMDGTDLSIFQKLGETCGLLALLLEVLDSSDYED